MCECNCLLVLLRSKELKSESVDLRERIKHLNDMVFCQQRKVKGMIEEVRRVHFPAVPLFFALIMCVDAVQCQLK